MDTPDTKPEQIEFWERPEAPPRPQGRPRMWETPRELWDDACRYFTWADANPWQIAKSAQDDGSPTIIEVPTARPYTIDDMCAFLGIGRRTWFDQSKREEFSHVISAIETNMRAQKFSGAAVGVFNANLISRDLGLADKQQHGIDPETALALAPVGSITLLAPIIPAHVATPPADQSEAGDTA